MRRDGAVVDYPTALRTLIPHLAYGGSGAEESAGEVGRDRVVPLVECEVFGRGRRREDAGVVEEQVDAAEAVGRGVEQLRHRDLVTDVALNRQRRATGRVDGVADLSQRGRPATRGHHCEAVGGECPCARTADAAA